MTEDGSFIQRYVYDENGSRISAEFNDADGTARGTTNANGEYGENPASDVAVNDIGKVWYRTSLLNSTLFAVDANGAVVAHMIYDPWGQPLTETYIDTNRSGLDNLNNYTGYSWDETLGLYYAQNRFYDAADHRFTQEDIVKDGGNWYMYCGNAPTTSMDVFGFWTFSVGGEVAAAFIARIAIGGQLVVDSDFEFGLMFYAGAGGGFPSASAVGTLTVTNAPDMRDLESWGGVGGGSGTIPAGLLVGANFGFEVLTTGQYFGATFSLGAGTSLPEMHGEITYTYVIPITDILKFFGLYDGAREVVKSYYDDFNCEQKECIKENFGVELW